MEPVLAAPYQSSNSTIDDIASGRRDLIAASILVRTGELRSLSTAMTAFVSKQIIRQKNSDQGALGIAAVHQA